MSRGFVKEEDQEEAPLIPPRAALPDGVTNYVTPAGHQSLLNEKRALEEEKRNLKTDSERERRRAVMVIEAKLKRLNERIASARIVDPEDQPKDEVRFGAIVEYNKGRETLKLQIVGVDEADFKQRKVAFTAPVARSMIGTKVCETAEFKRGDEITNFDILNVSYPK